MNKFFYYIYLVVFFALPFFGKAQSVGIGTNTPNASAALDIDVSSLATNEKKGFLMPRVALLNNTDVTTIKDPATSKPATGLIVYNTTANGTAGVNAVEADTFYFWDGVKWVDIANISTVRRELLPQVFFILDRNSSATSPQNTVSGTDNLNTAPVVVKFSSSMGSGSTFENLIKLNTGNNITFNASDYSFTINNSGIYEISGFINYNPNIGTTASTNLEFIIQAFDGTSWNNIAKTVGVWGFGTGANSRTNNVVPVIVSLTKNNKIRCVVSKSAGVNHTASSQISQPIGLGLSKVLKIQKLD